MKGEGKALDPLGLQYFGEWDEIRVNPRKGRVAPVLWIKLNKNLTFREKSIKTFWKCCELSIPKVKAAKYIQIITIGSITNSISALDASTAKHHKAEKNHNYSSFSKLLQLQTKC